MDKIKILAICQEDPEYILGGMGRHLEELYRAMAKRDDVQIDMLTGGPEEGEKDYFGIRKFTSDKLICWKPRSPNMTSLLMSDIQMLRTLMRYMKKGRTWDLVHVHEWNSYQVARAVRDSFDIPLVGTMHLCITKLMVDDVRKDHRWTEQELFLMQQEGHLITDVDELILCSRSYEKLVRKLFMTKRYINLIYNGIRRDKWVPSLKSATEAKQFDLPNKPIALFVGRIADMKGIRTILDVVENYDTGYCVVLAGEVNANNKEEREKWDVTKRIRRLQKEYPERLRWVGFVNDEQLKSLYTVADVGLMPSIHEPFGIVALEFMSMGVPLISTEVGGLKEIVVGLDEYSLIIRPNNPFDLYTAMDYLKNNMWARNELKYLGRRRTLDFDWDVIADKTVNVYKNLLRRKKDDCSDKSDNGKESFAA